MQSDRYLRVVLTVIAVCLVWICLRDVAVVKPAHAAETMDVRIIAVGANAVSGALPVSVRNWP